MRGMRGRSSDLLFGSAGWLFADLMLALVVMVFLAAATSARKEPTSQPPPSAVTTTTTTTTPVTTTSTRPPGLLPDPVKVDVYVDTEALLRNDRGAIDGMLQNVRGTLAGPLAGRRVGVVLTFGSASGADIQRGIRVAGQFNDQVLRAYGDQFAGAAYRSYFQGGGDLSKITLEIFVFDH